MPTQPRRLWIPRALPQRLLPAQRRCCDKGETGVSVDFPAGRTDEYTAFGRRARRLVRCCQLESRKAAHGGLPVCRESVHHLHRRPVVTCWRGKKDHPMAHVLAQPALRAANASAFVSRHVPSRDQLLRSEAVWLVLMAYLALGRARSGLVTSPYRLDTPPDRNWAPVPG